MLRYVDNPNGSLDDIAGVSNEAGNVVGLMPHPERASETILGSDDGAVLLRSLLAAVARRARRQLAEPRLTPARLSTSAETPSSRHDAYSMPLRSLYAFATFTKSASSAVRSVVGVHPGELGLEVASLLHELEPLERRRRRRAPCRSRRAAS